MKIIRIGTRKSQLALWQAHYVKDALLSVHEDIGVELVEIVSEGDRTLDIPLHQAGGKGLFLKELERALLDGGIDLAVHSMKDVTIELPKGLSIPVMCPREDPRDAFVSNHFSSLAALPEGSVVGTCSLRRQCQIRARFPHLVLKNLRGNVNSRLQKLDDGEFSAIILAAAGLIRLNMRDRIAEYIDTNICLPAVGQGIVGIQCRSRDEEINQLIAPLNDKDAQIRASAERSANARLGGGCHAPVAVFAELQDGEKDRILSMRGRVGAVDGSVLIETEMSGRESDPVSLGKKIADSLLGKGADAILASINLTSV